MTSSVRQNFQLLFMWSVLISLAVYVAMKSNLWVGLFFGLAVFSGVFPFRSSLSSEALVWVMLGVLWYHISVQLLNTDDLIDAAMVAILLIGLANVVFLLFQYFDVDPIHIARASVGRLKVGLMSSHNGAAAMLAFCFPAIAVIFTRAKGLYSVRTRLIFTGIAIVMFCIGFVLAGTFGGPFSIGVAIVVMVVIRVPGWPGKIFIAGVTGGVLMIYSIFVDPPDTFNRLEAWKMAARLFPEHWIFGSGVGHWKLFFARPDILQRIGGPAFNIMEPWFRNTADIHYFKQAHNEFIQMTFEMGAGFALIVVGYFVNIVRRYQEKVLIPLFAI
ncbi:hypothetical protein LCGC14_1898700, partial [marine sediment metagenome]